MRIKIIAEDFDKAGIYTDSKECLLRTALNRLYGNKADMGVDDFRIGDKNYSLNNAQLKKLHKAYGFVNGDITNNPTEKIVDKTPFTIYATLDK